jgi:hypothetical protein
MVRLIPDRLCKEPGEALVKRFIRDGGDAYDPRPRGKALPGKHLLRPFQYRVEPAVLVRGIAAGDGVAKAHVTGAKVLVILVAFDE